MREAAFAAANHPHHDYTAHRYRRDTIAPLRAFVGLFCTAENYAYIHRNPANGLLRLRLPHWFLNHRDGLELPPSTEKGTYSKRDFAGTTEDQIRNRMIYGLTTWTTVPEWLLVCVLLPV